MAKKTENSTNILNTQVTKSFMYKIIDYAGLFPPTQLPIEEAINNYSQYIKESKSWIVGPFVHPVQNIDRLNKYISLFTIENKLRISATGRKSESFDELKKNIKEDLSIMERFRVENQGIVSIEAYELPLPNYVPTKDDLIEVSKLFSDQTESLNVFLEPTFSLSNDWYNQVDSTIKAIADFNSTIGNSMKFSAKLRTGHVNSEFVPSTDKVAAFISFCRDYNVPLKFTAGLHHPVRMYREEIKGKMHGFLNVFVAGIMAHVHKLSNDTIVSILNSENSKDFLFEDGNLRWKDLYASAKDIEMVRQNSLYSYGSCSFEGPIEELKLLNIIKGDK